MDGIKLGLDYFKPTENIELIILFIGILFTILTFYFVFLKLGRDDYSLEERSRKKRMENAQQEKIARLYPKDD